MTDADRRTAEATARLVELGEPVSRIAARVGLSAQALRKTLRVVSGVQQPTNGRPSCRTEVMTPPLSTMTTDRRLCSPRWKGTVPLVERAPRPALLTIAEAAEYLHVPERWVQEAVRQRRVRCTRLGKHLRFRIEHLDELVTAGEQQVTGPRVALKVLPTQDRRRSRL